MLQNTYKLFPTFFFLERHLCQDIPLFSKQCVISEFSVTAPFSFPVLKLPNLSTRQAVCYLQQFHHDSFPERLLFGVILVSSITIACAFATKSVKSVNHCHSSYLHQCYGELTFWHWTKNQKSSSHRLLHSRQIGTWLLPDMELWKQLGS